MESNDRIERLEDQVGDLREDKAQLKESVENLSKDVQELASTVRELKTALDSGRGALWGISSMAAVLGAAASWAAGKLIGH